MQVVLDEKSLNLEKPSFHRYSVKIVPVTPLCVGGGEKAEYQSFEYFINGRELIFVDDEDILELYRQGLLSLENLNLPYTKLVEKIKNSEKMSAILRRLPLEEEFDNQLQVKPFARKIEFRSGKKEEKPVIFGSSFKGFLRSGFVGGSLPAGEIRYIYKPRDKRSRNRLVLEKLEKIGENSWEAEEDRELQEKSWQQNDYILLNKEGEEIKAGWSIFSGTLFASLMCGDLELKKGELKGIKAGRLNRWKGMKRLEIPVYLEAAMPESVFEGDVIYRCDIDEEDSLNFKPISCLYNGEVEESQNPVEYMFYGIKVWSDWLIKAEKEFFKKLLENEKKKINTEKEIRIIEQEERKIADFYEDLRVINQGFTENGGQIAGKIGVSGIMAKSMMAFDHDKITGDANFLPYTLLVCEKDRLPVGWCKIKWERI